MTVYDKEFLEGYRKILTKPKVVKAQKVGIDAINAETMELGVDCNKKAKELRANALNILTEALVEKCGGKMTYIIRD